jgi:hypothetical protein
MIRYETYKVLHIQGVLLAFATLARPVFWFLPVLDGDAVVMAIYKPF